MRTLAFISFLVFMVLVFLQAGVLAFGAPLPLPQGPFGVLLLIIFAVAFLVSLVCVQAPAQGG